MLDGIDGIDRMLVGGVGVNQDGRPGVVISRALQRREMRARLRDLQWERVSILEALANAAYGRRRNGFVVLLQLPDEGR